MNNQTSPVAILLQNRATFYRFALDKFPDAHMRREVLSLLSTETHDYSALNNLDLESDTWAALLLEDPMKKPDLGEKWGRTIVSYSDFFERAKQVELLVLEVCRKPCLSKSPIVGDLERNSENNLRLLAEVQNNLRYHRLRLFDVEK